MLWEWKAQAATLAARSGVSSYTVLVTSYSKGWPKIGKTLSIQHVEDTYHLCEDGPGVRPPPIAQRS